MTTDNRQQDFLTRCQQLFPQVNRVVSHQVFECDWLLRSKLHDLEPGLSPYVSDGIPALLE